MGQAIFAGAESCSVLSLSSSSFAEGTHGPIFWSPTRTYINIC